MENNDTKPPEFTTSHPEFRFSDFWPRRTLIFDDLVRDVDLQFTYDGRAALFQLFSNIRGSGRRSVLLPGFHCPTVVEPAIRAELAVRFYRVRNDLSIDVDDFLRCLDKDAAAALVINYFGFPANIDEIRTACQSNETLLIEDCAHSFLNAGPVRLAGDRADFAIFSFKKLVPSFVGGGLRCNLPESSIATNLRRPPISDSIVNLKRMIDQAIDQSDIGVLSNLKRSADSVYRFLKMRGKDAGAEEKEPAGDFGGAYTFDKRLASSRIPRYARHVLKSAQLDRVVTARQANYDFLRDQLTSVPAVKVALSGPVDSVCPWAIPVVIGNRSIIDRQLRSLGVPLFTFGETLHPALYDDRAVNERTIRSAEYLSSHLLCLSIHQGISRRVLEFVGSRVANVMRQSQNAVNIDEV